MAKIVGIKVKLKTNSAWWAVTSDKLYLGVYSIHGGREFRLNHGLSFSNTNTEYLFGLGEPCCAGNIPLVDFSTGGLGNDPIYNPIELSHVDHVYIRKEISFVDPAPSSDDDAMLLDYCEVLLCDEDGKLKKFSKNGPISLSDETGLQHWLKKGTPPRCEVTMAYDCVENIKTGGSGVGKNWSFEIAGFVGGNKIGIGTARTKVKIKAGGKHKLNRYDREYVDGCCGKSLAMMIWAYAKEHDWPGKDDIGQTSDSFPMTCSKELQTYSSHIDVKVKGRGNNESTLRLHYRLMTKCIESEDDKSPPPELVDC